MPKLEITSDASGSEEVVKGSDARLNVSSRADGRGYYNSRDESETYSLAFDDANASTADYIVYIKNDKTDGKEMVFSELIAGCESSSAIYKLSLVTGTAVGGATLTPTNDNQAGQSKESTSTSVGPADSSATPMTGLTESKVFTQFSTSGAYASKDVSLRDQIRLGQGQALALELDFAGAADVRTFGTIFFFFE